MSKPPPADAALVADQLLFAVIATLIAQRDEAQAALAKANKRISLLRAAYRHADG